MDRSAPLQTDNTGPTPKVTDWPELGDGVLDAGEQDLGIITLVVWNALKKPISLNGCFFMGVCPHA